MSRHLRSRIRRIALFGGSFNPPHAGHREIVRRVARRRSIDEVWVIPVYRHPFRKKLAPFARRITLCRQALKDLGGGRDLGLGKKVKVKDIERRLGGTSWTIRLIRHLKKRHPGWRFSLVLGADAYRARRSWKEFAAIKKEVSLLVFPRGSHSPIPNISSSQIRRRLK